MKKIFLITLVGILIGCGKNESTTFNLDDIVQTDNNGNVIGGSKSSNDWKLVDYNSSPFFADINSALLFYYKDVKNETLVIKNDCKVDSFNIKYYPNPMQKNQKSYARVYLSNKIKDISFGYKRKTNGGIVVYESGLDTSHLINDNTVLIDITTPQFTYGEDIEIFFSILDVNNCAYYFSGKVKL